MIRSLQEQEIENAKECARLGIITLDKAIETVMKAIRPVDHKIIDDLNRRKSGDISKIGIESTINIEGGYVNDPIDYGSSADGFIGARSKAS